MTIWERADVLPAEPVTQSDRRQRMELLKEQTEVTEQGIFFLSSQLTPFSPVKIWSGKGELTGCKVVRRLQQFFDS
jgi:hypothetical protein